MHVNDMGKDSQAVQRSQHPATLDASLGANQEENPETEEHNIIYSRFQEWDEILQPE
jgi:hypothetical protein